MVSSPYDLQYISRFPVSFYLTYGYLIVLLLAFNPTMMDSFYIPLPFHHRHTFNKDRPTPTRTTTVGWRMGGWPDELAGIDLSVSGDLWQSRLSEQVYVSPLLWKNNLEWKAFIENLHDDDNDDDDKKDKPIDHVWEQIKLEALEALRDEPEAGPQLCQGIISQGSLLEAIVTIVSRTLCRRSRSDLFSSC
jgi:hypothetical protein